MNKNIFKLAKAGYNMVFKPKMVSELPKQLNLEITNICNLNCKMCTRKEIKKKSPDAHLGYVEFANRVSEISPDFVSLAGFGEPTLNPDIIPMIKYLSDNKISSSITTNGTTIGQYAESFIDSGLNVLTLSIDSPDPLKYLKIRGKNKFPDIEKGLDRLNKLKELKKSRIPEISIHMVLMQDTFDDLFNMVDFAIKNKVCMVYFLPLEVESKEQVLKEIGSLRPELIVQRLQAIKKITAANGIATNIHVWLRDYKDIWKKYEIFDGEKTPISKRACVRPWISTYINLKGDVFPCCILAAQTNIDHNIGNINMKPFKNIWNNAKHVKYRINIREGKKAFKGCDVCVPFNLYDKYYFFSRRGLLK